jgi:hypothetical protein
MRGLPRFTAQGQVQQGGISEASAGAQSLTQLGQRLQQFGSQQLIRTQAQAGQEKGEMAGLDPNFRPERFGGIATQAYNQAALATNRAMMSTDAILGTQKNKFEAQQASPDANVQAQVFNQLQSQYATQMINQAPQSNKAIIQNVLTHQTGQSMLEFQQHALKQNQIKMDMQAIQVDNTTRSAELHQISQINWNAEPELVNQQVAAAGQYLKQRTDAITLRRIGNQLGREEAASMIKHANDEFNESIIRSQFLATVKSDPQKAADFINFVRDPNAPAKGFGNTQSFLNSYSPKQRAILAKSLTKDFQSQLNASSVKASNFTAMIGDEQRAILNGAAPNAKLRSDIQTYAPKLLPKFDRMTEDAQLVSASVKSILAAPLSAQDQIYSSQKPTPQNSGDEFGRDLGNWEKVGSMLAAARKAQNSDPAAYHLNQPEMSSALNEQLVRNQVGADFNTMPASGWKPLPVNVMRQLALSQEHYTGKDQSQASVLTNNMATGMVNQFNSLSNAVEKAQLMQRWAQSAGEYFPNMVRDLITRGHMSPSNQYIIGVGPNSPDIEVYDKMTELKPGELKESASKVDNEVEKNIIKAETNSNFKQYEDSLKAYSGSGGVQEHINDTVKFMQNYAMASMLTRNGITDASKAWKNAQNVFAARFNYGELDGRTIRVPSKYDLKSVTSYLENNKAQLLSKFNFTLNPSYAANMSTSAAKQQTLDTLVVSGGFVTNNTNDSMIYVDQDGKAIIDDKGNNLIVKLSDIPVHNNPILPTLHEMILGDPRTQKNVDERVAANLGLNPTIFDSFDDKIDKHLSAFGSHIIKKPEKFKETVVPGIRRAENATG